ncbi:MAG: DUF3850 domain-containing protein [Clostridiales bacterium]|nr:DUF3850 domain-containing protein [Clostridiales bacterium]MBQ1573855.1 DUF3850 domain-containing protein [Clostridiales bacterium]
MTSPLRCKLCEQIPVLHSISTKDGKAVWIQCDTCGIRTTWYPSNKKAYKAWRHDLVVPVEQSVRVHFLKLREVFFEDVRTGVKSFEVRKNDRGFRIGDLVEFYRLNKDGTKDYDVRIRKRICYILDHDRFPPGVPEGYVILGLEKV